MKIAQQIINARKRLGLTQEQLADSARITVRTIQRIESGESIPRAFTLKSLAEVLQLDMEELTGALSDEKLSENLVSLPVTTDTEKEKHFLYLLVLSCFSYLVIPFIHFLVPYYLLKKNGSTNPAIVTFGRRLIRQQIYWVICNSLLQLFTLAYNFLAVIYFHQRYIVHHLWPFFAMYIFNVFLILNWLRRVNKIYYQQQVNSNFSRVNVG